MTNPSEAPAELPPERLRRRCDPNSLGFRDSSELGDPGGFPGQLRAAEAATFGVEMRSAGYNLFALGPTGTGKHTFLLRFLQERARSEPAPADWCYVHNFLEPHRPRALRLPAGQARRLRDEMSGLVEELRVAIPAAFDSDEYRARKAALEEELEARQEAAFEGMQNKAKQKEIALIRTPVGLALAPIVAGRVVSPKEFGSLSEDQQQKVKAEIKSLEGELHHLMHELPRWEREQRQKIKELDKEVTAFVASNIFNDVRSRYVETPEVHGYFKDVEQDVVDNADDFARTEPGPETKLLEIAMQRGLPESGPFQRYQVNVLVDHVASEGRPVVYEDHPVHDTLVGRIEHQAQMGNLVTNFTLIKAGALHRANGGYLVLDARKVLMAPYTWEELKRALRSGEIRIEPLARSLGLMSTVSLEPMPIPLDLKVVLVGERRLYYLLSALDPDFLELFKVAVDFEDQLAWTDENSASFVRFVASIGRTEGLRSLSADGMARIVEQAARLAGDAERLTAHTRDLADLLRESDYWARKNGDGPIGAADVEQAVSAQIERSDRVRDRIVDEMERGTLLIDTSGEKPGQVNGLSVMHLGAFAFGRPSRITARVRLGKGEVVDIEREVELSGPLHSKGVLILAGFLGERFARDRPLSLSASLVFEQSYGGIEGDSASSAELYALLSALSGVPIKQSIAVTGSVNQYGETQAIGGVNEKIEGFFDLCQRRGLTGEQGVLIPEANVRHLMLRNDVVEAVAEGRFHVWPVGTVDEGIARLTGLPAGARDAGGRFPPDTVNGRVDAQLDAFAQKAKELTRGPSREEAA